MRRISLPLLAILALAVLGPLFVVYAEEPPAATRLAQTSQYCVACHLESDPRLSAPLAWQGGLERAWLSPCPVYAQLQQEAAYTDQAFDAVTAGIVALQARRMDTAAIEQRLLARQESLPRLLGGSYRTLDAAVNEARSVRYQANKVYAQVQDTNTVWRRRAMLAVGLLLTAFLLLSLAWGYRNTQTRLAAGRRLTLTLSFIALPVLAFVLFSLPLFNVTMTDDTVSTPEDLARQTALDDTTRATTAAETLAGRAWQLGRLAAAWSPFDKNAASVAISAAVSSSQQLAANSAAYWGQARSVEESAVTWQKAPQAAAPAAQRLDAAAARTWGEAALAAEILPLDTQQALDLLQSATDTALSRPASYFRDMDLKVAAVAWSANGADNAVAVANEIGDPFVRAWALREIAGQAKQPALFAQAVAAAQRVSSSYLKATALREIYTLYKNPDRLAEALAAAQALPAGSPERAWALSDLAIVSGPADLVQARGLVEGIEPAYAAARAAGYAGLARATSNAGLYAQACAELEKLPNAMERHRAQAELARAWGQAAPMDALAAAGKIGDPFWRAWAQVGAAVAPAGVDLARATETERAIGVPVARIEALAGIGAARAGANDKAGAAASFAEAASLAGKLRDPYVLRDLAVAWAQVEPEEALKLVDKLEREGDKALALLAIAEAMPDRAQAKAVYERALKQAQAARQRGDPLYATELLLVFGRRYSSVDAAMAAPAFAAALEAAGKVNTALP